MACYAEAKEAVLQISKKFGHLGDAALEKLERIDPDLRREVEGSLLAKDKIAGHSIITLAQNIYGSDARFVFELLQNADDNSFTRALISGVSPAVSFHVYTDRIVVECNEDGFTARDLEAICSVGESSESASHGYIGAKGIGFKSVFIAAWKVHVESGYFSFYFKHRMGDSGLGMVVPIWQDTDKTLQAPLTRMTLYLHGTEGEAEFRHLRDTIFQQLSDLQETSLLFLRKLKKISVSFYDEKNGLKSSRSFKSVRDNGNNVSLQTIESSDTSNDVAYTQQFHVTRHMASNLSRSESRQITDTEDAKKAAAVAEIILAFPLGKDSEPLIENQQLFAFLPVRESGFKFIIHSDFDTSANRQDIVTTSPRNIDLLDAIAGAFIKAVFEFLKHPDLCYSWPRFLPRRQDVSTAFWKGLKDKIQSRISEAPVLLPRHGTQLRTIGDLVILSRDFRDEEGNPLLDGFFTNSFLSDEYPQEAVDALKEYGLRLMHGSLFTKLLSNDLAQRNSKMKSVLTSQSWHSIMARLLIKLAKLGNSQLRSMHLLPLRSGDWVSSDRDPVYLPTAEGVSVPLGVGLQVLDPPAVANEDRRALFELFGAVHPSVTYIRECIQNVYRRLFLHLDLQQSESHLQFLYLSRLCKPKLMRSNYRNLILHTDMDGTQFPHLRDVYLPTDHPYGARELLKPRTNAPGLRVPFLHAQYLVGPPESQKEQPSSWQKWLCDFIGVREHLRLISKDGYALSDTWTYVATHRPDKLLGLLAHLWRYEGTNVVRNDTLKTQLMDTNAKMLCSSALCAPCTLKKTYLPVASLTRHCKRYMEETEAFPFLALDPSLTSEELRTKWFFLHEVLSVGIEDDLYFLLDLLHWIKQANSDDEAAFARHQRVFDLYIAIDAKCVASANQEEDRHLIAAFVDEHQCLYIPASDAHPMTWTSQYSCVWDGPPDMLCKYSLRSIFGRFLDVSQLDRVGGFFQRVLGIADASWQDVVEEIETMKTEDLQDIDRIEMLYGYIAAAAEGDEDVKRSARTMFDGKNLIYAVRDGVAGWYKSSECLWSSTTEIRGKVTLNDHYKALKEFFVETLAVRKLTLQMVYDELLQTNPQRSIQEAKSAIWSLNALLQSERSPVDPMPLLKEKILPISLPDGTKDLVNIDVDFSIGDREYLTAQFGGKIRMFDYDLVEIRQLKTFLTWTRLSSRNLSESVRAISSLGDERAKAVSSANRDLKYKAHALLRLAATFNSPRFVKDATGLYGSLRSMRTMVTDEISSICSVVEDGRPIEVESRAADVHIAETNGELTVYVPRDKRKQAFCFASPLSIRLADWLMRDSSTLILEEVDGAMVTALTTLLAVAPSAISLVLDHQGIVQVHIANEDAVDLTFDTNDEDEDDTIGSPVLRLGEGAPESSQEHASATHGANGSYRSLSISTLPNRVAADDTRYCQLLKTVVQSARRAQFPAHGSFDMAALRSALPGDTGTSYNGFELASRYHSDHPLERNFKIGAAGELYVFEIFCNFGRALRNWSRQNWQSNIRGRVSVHEDYIGMQDWGGGPETADFVYKDDYRDMTALLIEHGYLEAEAWSLAQPTYFLEVKTTTGGCSAPFYMSKQQYQRMTSIHASGQQQSEVYIILRVFEIENEHRMGMKVYLDPDQLRLDSRLVFTGESWSVIPGAA